MSEHLREWAIRLVLWTLCATLVLAVLGIVLLMLASHNVAAPVSLAVAGAWGTLARIMNGWTKP